MTDDVRLRAFEALREHPRLADLAVLAREVATAAAAARKSDVLGRENSGGELVPRRAEELNLPRDEADTPYGNALAALERGPEDGAERALVAALFAHALARLEASERETERVVVDVLWLAAHTPFDAVGLLDHALGASAAPFWDAIAEQARKVDAHKPTTPLARGEAMLAVVALATSPSPAAAAQLPRLAGELTDPLLRRAAQTEAAPPVIEPLEGELTTPPRGPVLTTVLALTGILLVWRAGELLLRAALAFKRPATVTFGADGITIVSRTEMLGRPLRRAEIVLPFGGLTRATREVRYPRLAFYAGLLALVVGSYFGLAFFVDGVRAASPSLLLTGLVLVGAGIALDFVLTSIAPSAVRKCRVLFEPSRGKTVCVAGVEQGRADAALRALSGS